MKKQQSIALNKNLQKTVSAKKTEKLTLIIAVLFGSILQSWHFLKTGWLTSQGINFSQLHDSLWHIALAKELARSIPPYNPGISGVKLTNYHYLSDLLLQLTHKITNLSVENIYFHLAPPIVSALFIISVYIFTKKLTESHSTALASSLFTLFAGSAAYLIPLVRGMDAKWFANSFMLDQPFDQLTNVHTVLAFSIFMFGSSELIIYLRYKKNWHGILTGICFAVATNIKAYAGVIGIAGLIISLCYDVIIKKQSRMWLPTIIALGLFFSAARISATTYHGQIEFAPGWVLTKMVQDQDRFFMEEWVLLENHYTETHNQLRLLILNLKKLLVYLIGNIWIRLVSLLWIGGKIKRFRMLQTHEVFIIGSICISLSTPLIFVLTISPHNTIQFSQYALLLMSILTIIWIRQQKKARIGLLVLVFLLALPTSIQSFITRSNADHHMDQSEYQSLKWIQSLPSESVILTPPTDENLYFMKVPGIGGRRTYISGITFASLTGTDVTQRIKDSQDFFSHTVSDVDRVVFLKDAKITHIYSNEKSATKLLSQLEKDQFPIKQEYGNGIYLLYSVQ